MSRLKQIIYAFWALIVLSIIILFILNPGFFEPHSLKAALSQFGTEILIIYILLSFLRGFFLLPSTPFVLLGVLLFPSDLWLVFIISMSGIILATIALYYFADILGFSEKLNKKFPMKMEKWKLRLNSPLSTVIVLIWSFFPLVPTDLICYVAGIVKMPFRYLITGVIIGEAILVYFYVFIGSSLLEYF